MPINHSRAAGFRLDDKSGRVDAGISRGAHFPAFAYHSMRILIASSSEVKERRQALYAADAVRECVNGIHSRAFEGKKAGVGVPKTFCFHEPGRQMNSMRAAVKTLQLRRYYATVIA